MNQGKKKRGIKHPLIIALVIIVAFVFGISRVIQNPEQYQEKSILAKELDLTAEQETTMVDIFSRCGIGEITSASIFQSGDGHTSYHLEDKETSVYKAGTIIVWVTDETKTVESIYFQDQDIYLNGAVVAPITDFYVNSTDRDNYRVAAQLAMNQILNYPDTAKYPAISGWRFGIEEGIVIVQSSVTSQNALGVEATIDFQVKFDNGEIISLVFEGKEYIQ